MNSVPLSLTSFTEPSQTMSQKKSTPYLISLSYFTLATEQYGLHAVVDLGYIFLLAVFSENTRFFVQPVENVSRHFLR